ncbi:MAG: hypothetical protein M9921_08470 [Fimbriimonadaceae bacterium]|nr:hypothetical protein [Fimbriimonadaceae bacterium]
MFGFIFYVGGCFIASGLITFLWMTMKPIANRNDMHSLRNMSILFVLLLGGPYAYTEYLTSAHGDEMHDAILKGFEESEIDGEIVYYKVLSVSGDRARAIAVGLEQETWGGTDRPIVAVTLERTAGEWEPSSFYVVYSDRLGRENYTFPPFR